MTPLLGAEGGELKSVVGSKRSDDLCGDGLLVDVGQWNLKDNQFAFLKRIGHERTQAALAQIPRPSLEV